MSLCPRHNVVWHGTLVLWCKPLKAALLPYIHGFGATLRHRPAYCPPKPSMDEVTGSSLQASIAEEVTKQVVILQDQEFR